MDNISKFVSLAQEKISNDLNLSHIDQLQLEDSLRQLSKDFFINPSDQCLDQLLLDFKSLM